MGSVVVAQGFSCSVACGIVPDQGSNPCPQHWQVDSFFFFNFLIKTIFKILFIWLHQVLVVACSLTRD